MSVSAFANCEHTDAHVLGSYGPCVDGSGLARRIFTCGVGRSSHVFGLVARYSRPLAIMPSADQVPVKTSHSMMPWPKWVVLIAGLTGAALRAVRPSNRYVTSE